ncbi:MAG: polysaccharide pyruvyl transferase family protein [Rhizomicrobium sp.]|nr:polysaccharide pyruvyl transferase family protein [Rhizomicrobium sp.]
MPTTSPDILRRLLLLNVKYSSNLGDAVLVECLEHELGRHCFSASSFDLAGRSHNDTTSAKRKFILDALQRLPVVLRRTATYLALTYLVKSKIQPLFRRALRNCDGVVLGGGNLLSDIDLNFPTKIEAVLREAKRAKVPVAIFGVGVSDDWTPQGERLFRAAFEGLNLVHVSVRDERSKEIWDRRLGSIAPAATVGRDPGLLASALWRSEAHAPRTAPVVGLSVMSPVALKYHSDTDLPGNDVIRRWNVALVYALVDAGYHVNLFTNGSSEDDACLRLLALAISGDSNIMASVTVSERPLTAEKLAQLIASCDVVIANRLHSNIVAYSFGIPSIGLSWNTKLNSFMTSVGRGEYLLDTGKASIAHVVSMTAQALNTGVDLDERSRVLEDTKNSVTMLAGELQRALAMSAKELP